MRDKHIFGVFRAGPSASAESDEASESELQVSGPSAASAFTKVQLKLQGGDQDDQGLTDHLTPIVSGSRERKRTNIYDPLAEAAHFNRQKDRKRTASYANPSDAQGSWYDKVNFKLMGHKADPLVQAVLSNDGNAVKEALLEQMNHAMHSYNPNSLNMFDEAARKMHLLMKKIFLEEYSIPDVLRFEGPSTRTKRLLFDAVEQGYGESVKTLLDLYHKSTVFKSTKDGSARSVLRLLQNEEYVTLHEIAAAHGRWDILKYLYEHYFAQSEKHVHYMEKEVTEKVFLSAVSYAYKQATEQNKNRFDETAHFAFLLDHDIVFYPFKGG